MTWQLCRIVFYEFRTYIRVKKKKIKTYNLIYIVWCMPFDGQFNIGEINDHSC
jgi:hypothetical protein